jgi:hypothetical protein
MDLTYAYALDIAKSERDENGNLIVYGKATGPDKDLDEDRCHPDWLQKAMPRWFEWGNMREMHQPILAGIGLEMTQDGDDWFVKSKVIDPGCAKKIEEGGYKGQSIGIKNGVRKIIDGQSWIVDGEIVEVSYVDRPCNPTAKLAVAKVAGGEWAPEEAPEEAEDLTKTAGPGEPVEPEAPMTTGFSERDRMKALAYINKAARAAAGEQSDVDGAAEAIAVISRLITSEAQGLADGDMGELSDIQTLIEAACSLKWFMYSEESEGSREDDMAYAYLAATADIEKRQFTAEQRRQAAASGAAMPGGRYPIENAEDLHNAVHALGRGKGDHAAIKSHIIRRAKALGLSNELPDDWKKTPAADAGKTVDTASTETIDMVVKAAMAEAMAPLEERNKALEAEIAKVKAQPIPGGPVLLPPVAGAPKDDSTTRAQRLRKYADALPDRAIAADYRALADKIERGE